MCHSTSSPTSAGQSEIRGSTMPRPVNWCGERNPTPTRIDLLLFGDHGESPIPPVPPLDIDPDARRRRVTALVWQVTVSREIPASSSSRTCTGSTRSANRCWPTSVPSSRRAVPWPCSPTDPNTRDCLPGYRARRPYRSRRSVRRHRRQLITELLATTLSRDRALGGSARVRLAIRSSPRRWSAISSSRACPLVSGRVPVR